MPFLHVSSNVAKAGVDTDKAARALSKSLAEALGAPEQLLLCKLSLDETMLFAKKSDPCAFVEIRSVKIDVENNPKTVKAITATVSDVLGVPSKRVFVNLQQIAPTHWGFNGATAARFSSNTQSTKLKRGGRTERHNETTELVSSSWLSVESGHKKQDFADSRLQKQVQALHFQEREQKRSQTLTIPAFDSSSNEQLRSSHTTDRQTDRRTARAERLEKDVHQERGFDTAMHSQGRSRKVVCDAPDTSTPAVAETKEEQKEQEIERIVRDAQKKKRRARAKAFESKIKLTWIQFIGSLFSLILVCTDVPRSGFGVNHHLLEYPTLEPDVFKFFGPWHYPMLNISREEARDALVQIWGYKQDTTSTGIRAFAKFFALPTFPDCITYAGPCTGLLFNASTAFEMLDSLVNAAASIKMKPPKSLTAAARQVSEPLYATIRSKNRYLDRFHHFMIHHVLTNPLWRTSQILYYTPEQLQPLSPSTSKNLCFDFATRPGFCAQFWSNFRFSCPETEPDCTVVARIWEHTMDRVRQVQLMYPTLQVDLTLLEGHEDLQLNKGGLSPTGMRRDDLETIIRVRQCNGAGEACSTVFIGEYRYEIGVVYSDALQWYRVVAWLRGMAQCYYYLRIAMLLKFCFNLTSSEDELHQNVEVRVFKACVLLLKMPVQAIIFGSPIPILLYAGAHAIDSAITYEVISNIFTSQNGLFQLKFNDLCIVGFNQMRSVWLLAMSLHVYVQMRATTQRRISWRPIKGIQGVPELLLSALASVTMVAQIRIKTLRDTRIEMVSEIVETQTLQAIKYQHNLGHHEYGHVMLGGAFIDFKFFVLLIALLSVLLFVCRVRLFSKRSSRYKVGASPLQTKTPVSYAAGVLWPVSAMCVHWCSDYFCIKPSPDDYNSEARNTSPREGEEGTPWRSNPQAKVRTNQALSLASMAMSTRTFHSIQTQMKSLNDRNDDVESSIAFMNVVAMSDPVVYFYFIKGSRGVVLGYYRSPSNPRRLFLLPCEVVNAPHFQLTDLELVRRVRSSELSFADLIHCG